MKLHRLMIPLACLTVAWFAGAGSFGLPPRVGPFGSAWSEVLWIRAELALGERRPDRALAFAERAVRTHPGGTDGWRRLVALYLLQPSSIDPARRLAAVDRGLALAARGTELAREPDLLVASVLGFLRGRARAEDDGNVARELLERAERFERDQLKTP